MITYSTSSNKGFTLLEILLVIAAIGILAAIVLVAINPNRQLAQARNAQRRSDVTTILNAVYQKIIDEGASGSTTTQTTIPTAAREIRRNANSTTYDQALHQTNCVGTSTGNGPITLHAATPTPASTLVPDYLASIPTDPSEPTASICSGYTIARDATTNRITVAAPNANTTAELSQTISVTR
jgi:prepilin-type N-terminal cleavage/methylation domain-containing protein